MTRCFVIGNGPSLAKMNLDRMAGEVSIGCNRIDLMYPKTKWRPTHWVSIERTRQDLNWDDIIIEHLDLGIETYIFEQYWGVVGGTLPLDHPRLHILKMCNHESPNGQRGNRSWVAPDWHLPTLCRWHHTGIAAIQLAVREGFNPIYVVGHDGDYVDKLGESHFLPEYECRQMRTIQQARVLNKVLDIAHTKTEEECKKRGVRIFNAGLVPLIYPSVNYEELF